jgi:FAD/FMN-containing dehydrogenase
MASIVGDANVVANRDQLAVYEYDWTRRWHGRPLLAVRPSSAEEVARVFCACREASVGIVMHGGNTGLVGGATPFDGEVVLDTVRLAGIGDVDRSSRQFTVGAGVTLERAQEHARAAGLDVAVDLAARSRATIGGMVATDAGGALAMRYGTMRSSVAGVEAVLSDGRVLTRLSGLLKDNAGYDLPALLIGSEGTLAAITRVRLMLVKRPAHRVVALIGLESFADAVDLVADLRDRLGVTLEAVEFFDRIGMELACARLRKRDPLPAQHVVYVLLQIADEEDPVGLLAGAVDGPASEAMAVAEDRERQRALWSYRETLNEAVTARGVVLKYDVSVPQASIAQFVAAVDVQIRAFDERATLVIYGHLGDGNLHVNLLDVELDERQVDDALSKLVADHGGSISAEHGIGRAKRAILHPTRSSAEIEAMRAIKRALDPSETLGRERVLPPIEASGR